MQLHLAHPADQVAAAIELALDNQMPHLSGVTFCLNGLQDAPVPQPVVDLSDKPQLAAVGTPPVPAAHYNQLLQQVVS